jgi:hypothetical protein
MVGVGWVDPPEQMKHSNRSAVVIPDGYDGAQDVDPLAPVPMAPKDKPPLVKSQPRNLGTSSAASSVAAIVPFVAQATVPEDEKPSSPLSEAYRNPMDTGQSSVVTCRNATHPETAAEVDIVKTEVPGSPSVSTLKA